MKQCRHLAVALWLAAVPAIAAEPEEGPAVQTSSAAAEPAATPASAASAGAPAPANAAPRRAQDRIELETTQITGNRELPRVLYVVPWKRPDLGDLTGRPANSLLDEVLSPVDRDVFRRQNRYYNALKPDSAVRDSAGPPEGEK